MEVIANNIANAQTTRTLEGGPYQRQMVALGTRPSFDQSLAQARNALMRGQRPDSDPLGQIGQGVRVLRVVSDPRPFKLQYDPTHPDADGQGYVHMPNVEMVIEMTDLISASRAYEANVTALNAFKQMVTTALQIGR